MLELVILGICALSLAFMAAWLTIGALENVFHPFLNETYTAEVMDMKAMREEYPEAYAHVSYRRLTSPTLRLRLFHFIVGCELAAMAALWIAVGSFVLTLFGVVGAPTSIALGLIGTSLFTSVWAGFLIVGNYFCYWFGHEGGQNTHFQMLQWGLANIILLVAVSAVLL